MAMDEKTMKRVVSRELVERLFAADILSPAARLVAIEMVDTPRQWLQWVQRILLFLGCGLVLSGTVFFFAYNWSAMDHFTKLGLIEGLIIVSVLISWRMEDENLAGKVLLLAGSVFVGVFLAVFGQTYQTGADAWQLFAGWSLLIFGWVLSARFAGLWLLWLIISDIALITYWHQMIDQYFESTLGSFVIVFTVINGGILILREIGLNQGRKWLKNDYHRWIVTAFVLICSTTPVLYLSHERFRKDTMMWVAAFIWLLVIGAIYVYNRYKSGDLLSLTMATAAVCIAFLTHIAPFLFSGGDESFSYLLFGFIVLIIIGPAAMWLKGLTKELKERQQ